MPGKLAWTLRAPPARKVGRAGADHEPDGPDRPRDHAAVRQRADPDPEIDVLFLEIDHAIRQAEAHQHLRINVEKRRRDRHDMAAAENH